MTKIEGSGETLSVYCNNAQVWNWNDTLLTPYKKLQYSSDITTSITDDKDIPTKKYVDGVLGVDSTPIGVIIAYYDTSIPANWLKCDGSTFD